MDETKMFDIPWYEIVVLLGFGAIIGILICVLLNLIFEDEPEYENEEEDFVRSLAADIYLKKIKANKHTTVEECVEEAQKLWDSTLKL